MLLRDNKVVDLVENYLDLVYFYISESWVGWLERGIFLIWVIIWEGIKVYKNEIFCWLENLM